MPAIDPKSIALEFNNLINEQDLKGLASLMTEDHSFIDTAGDIAKGKNVMLEGWVEFFDNYPDYRNVFSRVIAKDDLVIMVGHSESSEGILDGPALWTAKIRDGLVAQWRVYEDTEENRELLGID
ncbi:MAG: nuclear transport factor 2 family protein [Candidatus Thorarchaeota archaeon]|nr:nuclear transport factor 2 family protein [Candidatus Thorarchaeota archaeon]